MKTKFLIPLAFVLFATSLSAQFGARIGYNFANASVNFSDFDVSTGGSKGKFMAGIFYNAPLMGNFISVQPEINYMGRGYVLEIDGEDDIPSEEASFAYLDAGALLRVNLGGPDAPLGFYVGAGPFLSFAINGQINDEDIDFDAQMLRRNELLLAAAAGVKFGNFFVEARYYGSLSDQAKLSLEEVRQRSLGLNVGFTF